MLRRDSPPDEASSTGVYVHSLTRVSFMTTPPATVPTSTAPTEEEDAPVDIVAIMAEIRRSVKESLEGRKTHLPHYRPSAVEPQGGDGAGAIVHSEELNYLNANWSNWSQRCEITSHRRFIGPVIVKLKSYILRVVWNSLFREYFERERKFQANLVRHLNATARYIDKRDAEIFWQLVKKVDHEILALNERIDRFYDELAGTVRTIERAIAERITALEKDRNLLVELANRSQDEITDLDELIRGLERTIALLPKVNVTGRSAREEASYGGIGGEAVREHSGKGLNYLLLENRYRGSEESIKERQRGYVELFAGVAAPVLEIGCGRGEFLELLRERGIPAWGIDRNPAMVARCREKGLDVIEGDAIAHLSELPDASIGGVFAAQVVEHLWREQLEELLALVVRKVTPGGRVVFETINPQSLSALSRNFFRDPTHVWPLHPDTLRFMMETSGIRTTTIQLKSPYPTQATLQPIEVSVSLPMRWRATLQRLNDNIERLNDLLFGYQDFAIVGVV